jgi:membrane associated rhomboid family serine protease
MTVISVMVAFAAASGDWVALLGAALFYVSDATIAWNRFVTPLAGAKVVIIVTYHLAQFALVWSLVL